ncbi:hypothetical protein J437_LFUL016558 [Ladona fulva]|uniref:Uncharacterized protein n=1 Tax=Ladona fulva TaxID=123851 RepID=A0A8K0KMI5_LADFU|nr:hypothetical protein J437_LFUL016558 [Ladona fulva]
MIWKVIGFQGIIKHVNGELISKCQRMLFKGQNRPLRRYQMYFHKELVERLLKFSSISLYHIVLSRIFANIIILYSINIYYFF